MLELPLRATELIPQAPPMLLVDSLESCAGGLGRVRARLRPGGLFLSPRGTLDSTALVEMMAQTAASVQGYESRERGGRIRAGFLVGIKDLFFHADARVEDELVLESRRVFEMGEVSFAEARVLRGGQCLAGGTLKFHESETLPPRPGPAGDAQAPTPASTGQPAPDASPRSPIGASLARHLSAVEGPEPGSDARIRGSFRLPASAPCFQGHFPGYPLQAGVVTVQMGLTLLEAAGGRPAVLECIDHAKFQLPAYPEDPLEVELRRLEQRGAGTVWAVRMRRGDIPAATYSFQARNE